MIEALHKFYEEALMLAADRSRKLLQMAVVTSALESCTAWWGPESMADCVSVESTGG